MISLNQRMNIRVLGMSSCKVPQCTRRASLGNAMTTAHPDDPTDP
jgi:hypothetical protein